MRKMAHIGKSSPYWLILIKLYVEAMSTTVIVPSSLI